MAEQPERTPGIIDQAKAAYEQVVCAIIRPPRTTYDERHLGPRRFEFLGRTFVREGSVRLRVSARKRGRRSQPQCDATRSACHG